MAGQAAGFLGALFVGALAGAVAGSLVTIALRPPETGHDTKVTLDEAALGRAIAAANEPLRDEIRRLRAALPEGDSTDAPDVSPAAAASRPGRVTLPPADATVWRPDPAAGQTGIRPVATELTPPPHRDRLRAVRDLGDNRATRRRYLFMSTHDALLWFGTPDQVNGSADGEYWSYEVVLGTDADGYDEIQSFGLKFAAGHLVEAWGDEDPD